jgi:hypothetical protein
MPAPSPVDGPAEEPDGETDKPSETAVRLEARLRGEIVRPGDNDYDQARRVWNAVLDRRPALIVRPRQVADVIEAVDFARTNDVSLAVRGGGHSPAGYGTVDDGLVVDLSIMKRLDVDPQGRVAWAEPGLTCGEYNTRTHEHGDQLMEATLWPRGLGVISHDSALDLWELCDVNPAKVHVTVPASARIRREVPSAYLVHQRDLDLSEVTRIDGIPVVNVRRAILDGIERHLGGHLIDQARRHARAAPRCSSIGSTPPADEQPRYLLLAALDLMQMATGVVDPTIAADDRAVDRRRLEDDAPPSPLTGNGAKPIDSLGRRAGSALCV